MSKSKAVAKQEMFTVDMPDNAPALGFDPAAPSFNWREVLPSNFWSMDELEERQQQLGGWPVLTPARVVIKPVYDPAEYEGKEPPPSELVPKIVLEFAEASPALVMNKSRCEMATKITGTSNPAKWAAKLPRLVLINGVYNKKAQIVIEPAPNGETADLDDLNADLFD
ncbi:MAG: hypothetical protein KC421_11870 [Anaerolineales bacterium]|nr:hypothetical protein [Anaerolineales bacterium]